MSRKSGKGLAIIELVLSIVPAIIKIFGKKRGDGPAR